jgi:hypothetical protein
LDLLQILSQSRELDNIDEATYYMGRAISSDKNPQCKPVDFAAYIQQSKRPALRISVRCFPEEKK